MSRALDTLLRLARRQAEAAAVRLRPLEAELAALSAADTAAHAAQDTEAALTFARGDPRDFTMLAAYSDRVAQGVQARAERARALAGELAQARAAVLAAHREEKRLEELLRLDAARRQAEVAAREAATTQDLVLLSALRMAEGGG
jgi:hypothetical protein